LVKEFLSRRNVSFTERPIAEGDNLALLAARSPTLQTAPVTFVGDVEVIGWDAGALAAALADAGLGTARVDDEPAYRELGRDHPLPTASRWLLVTSFVESAVSSIPLDGTPAPVLADRTRALPGRAIAAAHVRSADAIAVVGCDSGTVTWLAADGSPTNGTVAKSSVPVGEAPLDVVADPRYPFAYVSASESRHVVTLDAISGAPSHGSVEQSRFTTPDQPGVMVFAAARDQLLVRQRGGGTLVFDGEQLRSDPRRAEPRVLPTPPGRGLALADDQRVLLAPHPFGATEGLWIYDIDQGLASPDAVATFVPTGEMPFGIGAHPTEPLAYVACFRPPSLEFRDARTGELWTGAAVDSIIALPSAARALTVDPVTDTLYVSCFDASLVLALDARTGVRRVPGTWETAAGPRGMVIV
jgi:hypothetical protein